MQDIQKKEARKLPFAVRAILKMLAWVLAFWLLCSIGACVINAYLGQPFAPLFSNSEFISCGIISCGIAISALRDSFKKEKKKKRDDGSNSIK